jgi:peptidoglycan hydrolase CwlO-like protein
VEELRVSIRNINEHLLNLSKKIREHQANFKRREKDMKAARDAIEKLKVSGF